MPLRDPAAKPVEAGRPLLTVGLAGRCLVQTAA